MTDQPVRPGVDPVAYRQVIGCFATGVAVVATAADGELCGLTVNSLTSVSLDPPLLLVCLSRESRTRAAVTAAGHFSVSLLARGQKQLSNSFARRGGDHFAGAAHRLTDGLPTFPGSIATLMCSVRAVYDGGDHDIVVGRVESCAENGNDPLVFYRGRYIRNISYDDYPAPTWWA
jgi:flavin reductase (DIM6/NTAB) family NADH-FMN oxidoreductase RutF